jgi:hypothetical protein
MPSLRDSTLMKLRVLALMCQATNMSSLRDSRDKHFIFNFLYFKLTPVNTGLPLQPTALTKNILGNSPLPKYNSEDFLINSPTVKIQIKIQVNYVCKLRLS